MTFTLTINCDNASFEDDLVRAIAKVLRHCARSMEEDTILSRVVRDRNGNTIGTMRLEDAA